MAATQLGAKKSTGGKAPRKQLATVCPRKAAPPSTWKGSNSETGERSSGYEQTTKQYARKSARPSTWKGSNSDTDDSHECNGSSVHEQMTKQHARKSVRPSTMKRSYSGTLSDKSDDSRHSDNSSEPPAKAARLDVGDKQGAPSTLFTRTPTTLEDAVAQITDLQAHIVDLYDLIDAKGFALEVSTSIRHGMKKPPDRAAVLAAAIRKSIRSAYEKVEGQTFNARRTGVTSDDVSKAMMKFFGPIEELKELPDPDAARLSYELVLFLADHSYGELDSGGCGEGDRPSDKRADKLLLKIAQDRKMRGEVWDAASTIKKLKTTAKTLAEYGIEPWFPRSLKLLEGWV